MRRRSGFLTLFVVGALGFALLFFGAGASARSSGVGDLGALGCIGTIGNNPDGCAATANLATASGIALSPDGKQVYVTSYGGGDVEVFNRGASGTLTPAGCVGDSTSGPGNCTRSGKMVQPVAVVVSPDGQNVYVANRGEGLNADHSAYAYSSSISMFSRSTTTGSIIPMGCVGGGFGASTAANYCGSAGHLDDVRALAVSPDGRNVYTAAAGFKDYGAVGIYNRSADGALTEAGCMGATPLAKGLPTGMYGCTGVNALREPVAIVVTPDGKNVYVGGHYALVSFARDPSGALHYTGCIAAFAGDPIDPPPECQSSANLEEVSALAVSPDGNTVYVATANLRGISGSAAAPSDAVEVFSRNANGFLSAAGCVGNVGSGPPNCGHYDGLTFPTGLAVSPDGRTLYVTAVGSNDVALFSRDSNGVLTYTGCDGNQQTSPPACGGTTGLGGAVEVAVSPDGKNVYISAQHPGTIAEFSRIQASSPVPTGSTTTPTQTTTTTQTTTSGKGASGSAKAVTPKVTTLLLSDAVVQAKGNKRTLIVKIRTASPVSVNVQLLGSHSAALLAQSFRILAGTHTLAVVVPVSIGSGKHKLVVIVSDASKHHQTLTATVVVPT